MIEIVIKTDGKEVYDSFDEDKPTLNEVGLAILRLEQMKKILIEKEFESNFEVRAEEE